MSLNKAYEKMKYDRRLLDLNLRLGQITKEEYDKFVESQPDVGDNAANLEIDEVKGEASLSTH